MIVNIYPFALPVYGPFIIQGYGIALVSALIFACWPAYKHLKRSMALSFDTFTGIVSKAIVIGVLGGRIGHIITEREYYASFQEVIAIWQGGLAILGAVIAVCVYVPYALKKKSIPLFPFLDIAAIYMPLAHAIGRLGCLWAGCCFGCQTSQVLAIQYHGHTIGAPVGVLLHPVQLYSAMSFFLLFGVLYLIYSNVRAPFKKPGTIVFLYLIGMSLERFFLDFLRDDRIMSPLPLFSVHQWIALAIGASASMCLVLVYQGFSWPAFMRHLPEDQ